MSFIISAGTGIPRHHMTQEEIKELVLEVFSGSEKKIKRLLPVFDHAEVNNRQFVVDKEWLRQPHSFQERNQLYQSFAKEHSLDAADECLSNSEFLHEDIPFEAIDLIVFVSSTGIATPSLEVEMLNDRPFRTNTARMPLWGLGCAGGAIGLSRASDWTTAYPEKLALVVCCELSSLTFQKEDAKKSNLVGSALFGDGAAAVLVAGEESPFLNRSKKNKPKMLQTSSQTKKHSTSVMGWNVTNHGLEVVFSKSIPALVHSFWKEHIQQFLQETRLDSASILSFLAHPGGKKVLDAMEEVVNRSSREFHHSHQVLAMHGNMSSATVLYVLAEAMKQGADKQEKSILSALGPGFSSELLLLEWC
ncbi:type III polyketide synthase [Lentibacillus sediminis]|uniref:type III polyketide synthase n=1 Tax=Lentibacillus sediminis TaxID=1940529 RepID=UPI000C1BAEE9|nr:3-oxoacyl-[acyl-carrier-protein] synthase III C-terminal domain-containing protein [Lentibacillus sediminis]